MKSWDVIVIGGGIIGVSLAISLRKQNLRVLIVERGEAGREASYAAAGMLAGSSAEIPAAFRELAEKSARFYPEFVHELEDESGVKVDLRDHGTILLSCDGEFPRAAELLSPQRRRSLEPSLAPALALKSEIEGQAPAGAAGKPHSSAANQREICAAYLAERSVDPRALVTAAIKAAHHRQVDIASGAAVRAVLVEDGRVSGVQTERTTYSSAIVVNCAGAWAGSIGPHDFPVRPVKGQMLAVVGGPSLEHVVRSEKVYLVPRSDRRIVIGSTVQNAGFNKKIEPAIIEQLFQAAVELVPSLSAARRHEAWAGLRPGTPDGLPILGETLVPGFFAATGHYRDGILLAPVTAQVMTELITSKQPAFDLRSFSPSRFEELNH